MRYTLYIAIIIAQLLIALPAFADSCREPANWPAHGQPVSCRAVSGDVR
jgi:hypothetical protein